ncbi:MAG: lysine--tRNA ligase, partial [Coriobacteriales bacterium]|nr:lysine--tRNA ligase [Coriobacteriales bacterium]
MTESNKTENLPVEDRPLDDPILVRKAKRQAIFDAGDEPYRRRYDVDAHAAELAERYADLEDGADTGVTVHVAGRVIAKRGQGKVCFLVLRDGTGEIQVFCRINALGEEAYAAVKDLDVGDWIGVEGTVLRTRRGELSVAPGTVTLLSKSLRPLPEKFHGLSDKETRYRQRYVD